MPEQDPKDIANENRAAALVFIRRMNPLGIASGSFEVLDDEGVAWSLTVEKKG